MIFFKTLTADLRRYTPEGKFTLRGVFYLLFTQGAWAITVYRIGRACKAVRLPVIGILLRLGYFLLFKSIEIVTGISIDCNARIGAGFYIGHFGQIFVHGASVLGDNCSISQGVTVGTLALGKKDAPVIGRNVYIGAGAKVLGGITIGDNARIGANAVVIHNVPENATAVGIPARIIQRN